VKNRIKISLAFLIVFANAMIAQAECSCTADPYSKTYSEFRKTWYGSVRAWSCRYTCTDGFVTEEILGNHRDWYAGDETGLEGICEGLIYQHEYIIVMDIFTYAYKGIGIADPAKSKSAELKSWATKHEACR
jgi:hypothetical protein